MIQLTRLNNLGLLVNCDLIKFVESSPDTVITLVSGEKILVRETPEQVMEKIVQFRRVLFPHDGSYAKAIRANTTNLIDTRTSEPDTPTSNADPTPLTDNELPDDTERKGPQRKELQDKARGSDRGQK